MIRLGHVNIRTTRLQETAEFYSGVLGLTPGQAATRPDSDRHIWMFDSAGAPIVHVQQSDEVEATETAPLHHFAFDCDDLQHWYDRLTSFGIDFTQSHFPHAGLVQLNLCDPNGVRLELTFAHSS